MANLEMLVSGGMQVSRAWELGARLGMVAAGMVMGEPAGALHDRRSEREVLERLLEAVRGGQSRVLVVSGEPGAVLNLRRNSARRLCLRSRQRAGHVRAAANV